MANLPPNEDTPVPGLDPLAADRWQARVPAAPVWLNEEIGRRMADRLQWIKRTPSRWLDWSPLWGGPQAHAAVCALYPEAQVLIGGAHAARAVEVLAPPKPATPFWRRWGRQNPLVDMGRERPDPGVDMVWANMALHLTPQPQALLRHWLGCLAVDGFVMFSCLGPDSLLELRQVYAGRGWAPPAHAYTDMHDWGDMLVEAGFAEPVMDMERITLTYSSPEALVADLRLWGRNLHTGRPTGLRGRGAHNRWLAALAQDLPRDAQGAYNLTFEVVYGHALKGAPRLPLEPTTSVPVDQMRAMLKQARR